MDVFVISVFLDMTYDIIFFNLCMMFLLKGVNTETLKMRLEYHLL